MVVDVPDISELFLIPRVLLLHLILQPENSGKLIRSVGSVISHKLLDGRQLMERTLNWVQLMIFTELVTTFERVVGHTQ